MRLKVLQFLKDKFDILLITSLFVFVFVTWIGGPEGRADKIEQMAQGLLYALLALLGLRPRTSPPAIDTATTGTGDINLNGPADPATIEGSKDDL